eukprot:1149403-Pelagomonas_calceolata.AAC.11
MAACMSGHVAVGPPWRSVRTVVWQGRGNFQTFSHTGACQAARQHGRRIKMVARQSRGTSSHTKAMSGWVAAGPHGMSVKAVAWQSKGVFQPHTACQAGWQQVCMAGVWQQRG